MNVRLLLTLTSTLVIGALVAWIAALLVGLSASSADAVVVLRTLFVAIVLFLLTRVVIRRTHESPELTASVGAAAFLSCAVFPATWSARALGGQLVAEPGPVTLLIDLVVWVAVVFLAGRSVSPKPAETALSYQV